MTIRTSLVPPPILAGPRPLTPFALPQHASLRSGVPTQAHRRDALHRPRLRPASGPLPDPLQQPADHSAAAGHTRDSGGSGSPMTGTVPSSWRPGDPTCERFKVVAYDFGVKANSPRLLAEEGCRVSVIPSVTPVEDVLAAYPTLLAHELTHIVQFVNGGGGKWRWELEGGATLAESLVGFEVLGHASGQDLGWAEMVAGQDWYSGDNDPSDPIRM